MKSRKWARRRSGCKKCFDGIFPCYGMAPHRHLPLKAGWVTVMDAMSSWPKNFVPDPEQMTEYQETGRIPSQGVWYCPKCHKTRIEREFADLCARIRKEANDATSNK